MSGAHSTFAHGFFQHEDDGHASKARDSHVTKIIHIRPKPRLGVHGCIDQPVSLIQGLRNRCSPLVQELLHTVELIEERHSARCDIVHQFIAVQLLVADNESVYDRNADAATDVAHQVV